MQNLEEKDMLIFGSDAGNQDITIYGTPATGSPQYSKNPTELQNANWLSGLLSSLDRDGFSFGEDQNAIPYVITYILANLQQKGISQWSPTRTYYTGSICGIITNGNQVLYMNKTGINTTTSPQLDIINWFNLNTINFTGLNLNTPIDFNTYTQQGNYNLSSNLHTNAPIDTEFACNLQVLTDGSTMNVVQLVQDLTNSTSYVRYRLNDVWGEWGVNDLNNKANTDLSNLTPIGKETIANLASPSNRFINLTATGTAGDYIAPANGYMYILVSGTGTCALFLNSPVAGGESLLGTRSQVDISNPCCYIPCKKNDKVSYLVVGTITTYKFVYLEGN